MSTFTISMFAFYMSLAAPTMSTFIPTIFTFILIKAMPALISMPIPTYLLIPIFTPTPNLCTFTPTITTLTSIISAPFLTIPTSTTSILISQRPKVIFVGEEDNEKNDFQLSFCGQFVSVSGVFDMEGLSRAELKKKQLDK